MTDPATPARPRDRFRARKARRRKDGPLTWRERLAGWLDGRRAIVAQRRALAGPLDPALLARAHLLPNAFLIGAAKSGTTTLAETLRRHPEIWFSRNKEPKFFGSEFDRGWDWYLDLFARGAGRRVRMEGSTKYTSGLAAFRLTPALVRRFCPEARLVYVVRHPLDRIVSQWRHVAGRRSWHRWDFADLLRDPLGRELIVPQSMYWARLQEWRAHFPDEAILCLTLEELTADPVPALARLLDHLGLPSGAADIAPLLEDGRLLRVNEAGSRGRALVPRPDWPPALRARVAAMVAPDARAFLRHIGLPEDHWDL